MRYKNSYFEVDIRADGTYIDLYPPMKDGQKLTAEEIYGFLEDRSYLDYDREAVKRGLEELCDKPVTVRLGASRMEPFNEIAVVKIAKDEMTAYMRFYPPSRGGSLMNKREILAELEREKIVYGVSDKVIDVFMQARQYCLNIPVARGTRVVPAKDTVIEYMFNTKPLARPKVLEDGSVDFHELNLFTPVHKGDVLAVMTPHDNGAPGKDVYGRTVSQNKPKITRMKYGRNISLTDDGLRIISEVDGNVTFTDGTVFVSDTYNVAADVDASTGDINYDGNVMISGTVKTGFTVKAGGDIQVNGIVEGATLIAGGNIVIKRGVQGMNRGELIAGGDLCAQFMECANVNVKGDVTTGSIVQSRVISGGKIIVSGRKGFIVGGELFCERSVEVNTIGNKMETQTLVKVGVRPELYEEMKKLVGEVRELNSMSDEIGSYLNVFKEKLKQGIKLSPSNIKQVKEYHAKLEKLNAEKNVKSERLVHIKNELDKGKRGFIRVTGYTYRGVTLFISNRTYAVKNKDVHSLYKIVDGDIKPTSF